MAGGSLMATLVFFLFVWLFCKGVKALFRPQKTNPQRIQAKPENRLQANLATLYALQQQRNQINNTIDYVLDCISTADSPEKTIQYKDRLSGLYGKLANVETKINKLIAGK
jgi:hypothetical protein